MNCIVNASSFLLFSASWRCMWQCIWGCVPLKKFCKYEAWGMYGRCLLCSRYSSSDCCNDKNPPVLLLWHMSQTYTCWHLFYAFHYYFRLFNRFTWFFWEKKKANPLRYWASLLDYCLKQVKICSWNHQRAARARVYLVASLFSPSLFGP
jgi:hypothetical protein